MNHAAFIAALSVGLGTFSRDPDAHLTPDELRREIETLQSARGDTPVTASRKKARLRKLTGLLKHWDVLESGS